jgi:hypothetical protein
MNILIVICLIAINLLIWFRTEAWLEYTRIFHLNWMSYYKDFDSKYKEDASLTYLKYLRMYHNCFAIRMLTCPICQAVWWGIGFGILTALCLIPIYIVGGLLLFLIIDKLLG